MHCYLSKLDNLFLQMQDVTLGSECEIVRCPEGPFTLDAMKYTWHQNRQTWQHPLPPACQKGNVCDLYVSWSSGRLGISLRLIDNFIRVITFHTLPKPASSFPEDLKKQVKLWLQLKKLQNQSGPACPWLWFYFPSLEREKSGCLVFGWMFQSYMCSDDT